MSEIKRPDHVLPDEPTHRPLERFWPYADLSEQPSDEELATLNPEIAAVVFGAPALPFSISLVFPIFAGDNYARAVELAKASDEYVEVSTGGVLTHRARFFPSDRPARLRDLYELVADVPESEVLVDEGPEPGAPAPQGGLARLSDVAGLRPLRTVDDLEFDLLAFLERPEAGALNRREVHEHVVTPLAFNESVPLRVVKPLDLTSNTHTTCLPYKTRGGTRRGAPSVACSANTTEYKKRPPHAVSYSTKVRSASTGDCRHEDSNCQP